MQLVSLPEFLSITQLSERDVLHLLSTGELVSKLGSLGEVLIDISALTPEILIASSIEHIPSANSVGEECDPLLAEIVATEVLASIDEILNESLAMAASWIADKQNKT